MDDKELQDLLFKAVRHHNDGLLENLLEGQRARELLDSPSSDGSILLHTAVLENDLNCVRCLLKHGANPNIFDTVRARTPLHLAVELNQVHIVKAFLELEHINIDICDDRNLTCHEIAQFCDNQHLADLIREKQEAEERLKNEFYRSMNQACSCNDVARVREILEFHEKQILSKLPESWLKRDSKLHALSNIKELINWSSSTWNDVTLLFKSASQGYTEICQLLIEHGATAKCNDNTNYSPLYVAAYGGYSDTVSLLLANFPSLIREVTIEKWTPLHACCLQGHSNTAKLILNYPYSSELKHRFLTRMGNYEYHYAFDLNAQDAAGQTSLYLAVSANDEQLLDTLMQFKLEATLVDNSAALGKPLDQVDSNKSSARVLVEPRDQHTSDSGVSLASRTGHELEKIINQLAKSKMSNKAMIQDTSDTKTLSESKYLICPFELDIYCDYNSKTALHLAVCRQYHSITTTLLVNGANPNLPILCKETPRSDFGDVSADETGLNWRKSSTKSTCLEEACKLNNQNLCEVLMQYGAYDNPDNSALKAAVLNKNNHLISKFLSLKSSVDLEYKINKKCNVDFASGYKHTQELSSTKFTSGTCTTTFSSMFPSTPVMVEWQNLKFIKRIDPQWLIGASILHNKRLKQPPISLIAITRLDLSSNDFKQIHPVIFRLPSLRELNLSNNQLECLIDTKQRSSIEAGLTRTSGDSYKSAMKRSKSYNITSLKDLDEPQEWDLPYLETLDLHDNRLISLPDCLFTLPKLRELDISSNQIRQLPHSIWSAPSLREVIASGNLLDDLPKLPVNQKNPSTPESRIECTNSPLDDVSSITSNNLSSLERNDSFVSENSKYELNEENSFNQYLDEMKPSNIHLSRESLPLIHIDNWMKKVDIISSNQNVEVDGLLKNLDEVSPISKINYFNLSHNSFSSIPPMLACFTSELSRLNMSHNRITSLGELRLYPKKLKSIDLSHNLIVSWFTLDQDETNPLKQPVEKNNPCKSKLCYLTHEHFCPHKVHFKLENLKSLNLGHNSLKDIQLRGYPMEYVSANDSIASQSIRDALLYPNLTALDLSYNKVQQVPADLSHLRDLSVLNLNGNISISTLPPELGMATKLWNLGINGCSMSEPLKSIVESKTYKTVDIIGYLRSILEESKPYARMKLMLVGLQGIGKTSLLELMRSEGSSGLRRRVPEHWTKRMGHATRSNIRNQKGVTLSTVGVDIHDWVYCKRKVRNQPNFGPVSFSTWDFGGQQEFYATHRYFLSKRSIYLVVWRLTDGIEGINGIQQWLINIQSRAAGSPVIIVGTHEDMIEGGENGKQVSALQTEVYKRFLDISDHDRCGLPKVFESIVVSVKTRYNIKYLCDRVYDTVFNLTCPGSNERLLEQKIPATYLYLEEIVNWIVHDRQQKKLEPVLNYDDYRRIAADQLRTKYNKTFRDLEALDSKEINYNSELQQATRFLHENGILLHYEDANLRDLFFLDPQWLCDILSHVVTIREINPHVKNGLMKMSDLGDLFKSIDINFSGGTQAYVVNLLNKFEVALTWSTQFLLIPSLLPSDPNEMNYDGEQNIHLKPGIRTRGRSAVRGSDSSRPHHRAMSIGPNRSKVSSPAQIQEKSSSIDIDKKPDKYIHRLVMLRYLPAGFLPRLQSSILSDTVFDEICQDVYDDLVSCLPEDVNVEKSLGSHAGWICWKSGIKLSLQNESTINCRPKSNLLAPLAQIRELSTTSGNTPMLNEKLKIESLHTILSNSADRKEQTEKRWRDLDVSQYLNIISITVYNWRLKIVNPNKTVLFIELKRQYLARLMATMVDHIDNLLEDWYPSLGTRFAHTLGGEYLVTRVIPCTSCFANALVAPNLIKTFVRPSRIEERISRGSTKINFNFNSMSPGVTLAQEASVELLRELTDKTIFCFHLEHCIFNAYNINYSQTSNNMNLKSNPLNQLLSRRSTVGDLSCPKHGTFKLSCVAPDIVFEDIPEYHRINNEQLERCKLLGRGTFGFVFKGQLRTLSSECEMEFVREVALKLLQPVDPGAASDTTDMLVYNSAKTNWIREPFQSACKSYCTARHELNILQSIRHPNIVLFIGLCIRPLAIVLELARSGCLADTFKSYKRAGARIDKFSIQKTILQISRALEFLHQQKIIYRDLKAENILVWDFPSPLATQPETANVELKLADYGISRRALSTGIWKGFAGTINFLAPEILRHNGDEEYTEKVDCFSFGMFLFELLTLRPPYKHGEGSKFHLTDGCRPTLTSRDLIYPNHMYDLMSVCWSQEPHHRPTASKIAALACSAEFLQLLDVAHLNNADCTEYSCVRGPSANYGQPQLAELWLSGNSSRIETLGISQNRWTNHQQVCLRKEDSSDARINLSCMCIVEDNVWLCDIDLNVYIVEDGAKTLSASNNLTQDSIDASWRRQKVGQQHPAASSKMKSFLLQIPEARTSVQQMAYVKSARSVVMLLESGQLWLYRLDTMDCNRLDDNSVKFRCLTVQEPTIGPLIDLDGKPTSFNIYCGYYGGFSYIEVEEAKIVRQKLIPLGANTRNGGQQVSCIQVDGDNLWTSVECLVRLWRLKSELVALRELECWKLLPCSESLDSLNIERYHEQAKSCSVTSMVHMLGQLFIGTSLGCLIVVEANSMTPLIVLKPYERDLCVIRSTSGHLITVGTGYRDLFRRHSLGDVEADLESAAILWSPSFTNV